MRSAVLLRLALGLLTVCPAVAGPCIPGTKTTAVASTASTETSVTVESSSSLTSTTSSDTTESSVETSTSSTVTQSSTGTFSTTISVETSASSTASTETSASSTALDETSMSSTATETSSYSVSEATASTTTSDFTTTTEDTTTSTTSLALTITLSIVATGSGLVEGESLETYNRDNNVALFGHDSDSSVRSFYIDSQGRLINDQGFYLCGFYDGTNDTPNVPAEVGTCVDEVPMFRVFLKCQSTADLKLTCSIPAISCVGTPNGFPGLPPTCLPSDGTWSNLYVRDEGPGEVLQIGDANPPSYCSPVGMSIQVV